MAKILKNVANAKKVVWTSVWKKLSFLHNINYSHSICHYLLQCKNYADISSFYHQFSVSFSKGNSNLFLVLIQLNISEDYHSCSSLELDNHNTNSPAIFLLHLDQSLARAVFSSIPYFLLIALLWKSMLSSFHLTTHNINNKEVPRALMLL